MFLVFWGILLVVFGVLWSASFILFVIGWASKLRIVSWLGGVPLVLLTSLGCLAILSLGVGYFEGSRPESVYKEFFGSLPSKDVTNIRVSNDSFGDYQTTYVAFNASPTTIRNIVRKGWRSHSPQQLSKESSADYISADAPSWWRPVKTKSSQVYEADKRLHLFSVVESETLVYDYTSRKAYYSYEGLE